MSTDQRVHDLEAIKQLKARYFRYTDTKQWEALRDVFTTDAIIEGGRQYASLDEFIADRVRFDNAITTHHGHMPEIVFSSATMARGIWAMYDRVEYPEPFTGGLFRGVDTSAHRIRGFVGSGHYEEEYTKGESGWQISLLRLTRLRLDPIVSDPLPPLDYDLASHGTAWLQHGEGAQS